MKSNLVLGIQLQLVYQFDVMISVEVDISRWQKKDMTGEENEIVLRNNVDLPKEII